MEVLIYQSCVSGGGVLFAEASEVLLYGVRVELMLRLGWDMSGSYSEVIVVLFRRKWGLRNRGLNVALRHDWSYSIWVDEADCLSLNINS